jgi:hypothetical protein
MTRGEDTKRAAAWREMAMKAAKSARKKSYNGGKTSRKLGSYYHSEKKSDG